MSKEVGQDFSAASRYFWYVWSKYLFAKTIFAKKD